ncbi:DUF262 domain-containing protein [Rhodopirellula sp. JC740]|uniref:DUF262 domain-containing protein n=1 Tax=Rhodopirellula halodulae TaxID=2894198 RepID=A0ABS8NGS1_9BACT|nr:DUF262 domain-containing protein [Rhodopirellula sp. JC740]MCC9641681.1 DUF262 domain-containing protein [Rhodopirellula sp. JC740]
MKATEAKLIEFLKKSPQFVIPIYQRTYSWTEKECRQLWDDVLRTGKDSKLNAHFVGSIVYIQKGHSNLTVQEPLLVIDGQQRLTTLTLLLAALANAIEKQGESKSEPVDGFSPRKIRNYYLLNPEEDGERHYKLLLTQTDKQSLISILNGSEQPHEKSLKVTQNYALFEKWIADAGDLETICNGIAKLMVVDVALTRDQDNPQLIFESMNSTGKELSQADLIRNYVLMGLEPKLQTRLYEQYWRPMEMDFGQEAYGTHFDAFMRHYLTVKTGDIPRLGEIYDAFKAYARSSDVAELGTEHLVKDVRNFAKYFCAMALGAESDPALKLAFHDLRELKVDVAYPFLLELYSDYAIDVLDQSEFLQIVRLIEAYVFRRAICAIPTNSMNKTFSTFTKSLRKANYLESVQSHFLLLPSYRRFPRDEEFKRDIKTRDLYNFRSRSYWLRRVENLDRKERVVVDEYTIEHIMPQNESLSQTWRTDLGEEWKTIHETWLHTLGNLTLTGYNSEYSDRPFSEKRDMEGGFKVSPLKLNAGLGQLAVWNEEEIKARAERLSKTALQVWQSPKLDAETLEKYRDVRKSDTGYCIEDHPQLLSPTMRPIFDAFRKQVLALDPCVTEEFLKLYVAYKAETNFVDVVPQSKRLRLSINIDFNEINDPRGICKDVTNLGRWGNGNVEVILGSLEELQYVIGLIRQALEKQLGSTADA